MKRFKGFLRVCVGLLVVSTWGLSSVTDIAEARPNKPGKPAQARSQGQGGRANGGGPPDWAPAWGYRCNQGQAVNHPGGKNCGQTPASTLQPGNWNSEQPIRPTDTGIGQPGSRPNKPEKGRSRPSGQLTEAGNRNSPDSPRLEARNQGQPEEIGQPVQLEPEILNNY